MIVNKFVELMDNFIERRMSANDFQAQYLKMFKESDARLDSTLFGILNDVFEAVDCYWHECPPGQETAFEISEQQLRTEINESLVKLSKVLNNQ